MAARKKIEIVQDEEEHVPVKLLATKIVELAKGMKQMLSSGLKEDTIVILLHEETKVGRPDIRRVLRALPELAERWTTK